MNKSEKNEAKKSYFSTYRPKISTITWEDAQVELSQLEIIIEYYYDRPNALLLASSADTALAIYPQLDHLTVVSNYTYDLALFHLKKALLNVIKLPSERSHFLEGTMSLKKMIFYYHLMEDEMGIEPSIFWRRRRLSIIFRGLNNFDPWLDLFQRFKRSNRRRIHSDNDSESSFRGVFSNRNLNSIISPDQFYNSLKKPFHQYFKELYHQVVKDIHSPFSHLIIKAEYELHNYPLHLNQDHKYYDEPHNCDILNQEIIDYLTNTSQNFSLISLGNLSDEFDADDLDFFFSLLKERTKVNGRIIVRRRNTDFSLHEYINRYFIILNFFQPISIDRTYLYRELIIATPRK